MFRNNAFRWWNALFYAAVLGVNYLAMAIPMGGMTTGQLSDKYHTPITPAGYAFMIWALIYLLLAGYIVYQLRRNTGRQDSVLAISYWFILSCIFNMAWVFLWQYQYIALSFAAMLALLLSLAVIYAKTRYVYTPTSGETWLLRLPFSIYFGWICVATLVNLAVILFHGGLGINLNPKTAGIILLSAGTAAAIGITLRPRDGVLPLVFVWAYAAIAIEQKSIPGLSMTAAVLAFILLLYALWIGLMRSRERD
ncbi:tryptophan-rich sensory protein [Paenibacillus sp. FSL W8-0186]|uniref:Tryptophan-rich sensory protein n=1 Tax=Paenibacillus woosongensis TaxID=307580 RepID=A0ABQ4MYC0_9BACL|nr:tryptophan-rich sensory protein [Paenibacillus woosongensis]GIP60939.1 tryptophan-rich sensory protein [Paenibacillus woosongensis]